MSNVNIKRAVENIRTSTTVYTPIVETIVNAIEAIEAQRPSDGGRINVRALRSQQIALDLDTALREIVGLQIEDNGIGFTDENRNSFDTLYSDHKARQGGKGFGRFICMKYFDELNVDSTYVQDGKFKRRRFSMGHDFSIVIDESVEDATRASTGSVITLTGIKGKIEKTLPILARNIVEKLLPYFITADYKCPRITLSEADGSEPIVLNDYVTNELASEVKEVSIANNTFTLESNGGDQHFLVRVFKFYSPKHQKSKISLVAHKREVSDALLHDYIPEFSDEFYERDSKGEIDRGRNYILKAYVFSSFLDATVSLERGDFRFQKVNDIEYGVSQYEIEGETALIAKEAVGSEITTRQERKLERVLAYVDKDAPWHKTVIAEIDLSDMPYNPTNEQIESRLQAAKYTQDSRNKRAVTAILEDTDIQKVKADVPRIVSAISDSSKGDLIHYIALRKGILELFKKSLELDANGKYSSEGIVHDIIFPRRSDTDTTPFHDHNLWIVDERLNFTSFLSSDIPGDGRQGERPDLLAYDQRVVFRGDNEPSNPVIIFEFKKPGRDDFANPSAKDDPIDQIVRYVNNIKQDRYLTPKGRKIQIGDNTPFYGYVVCDLKKKVEDWLHNEKDFKPMPDRLGWFRWFGNINLYMEVNSWDKVLKDANMRNQIFFHTLGLQ
jgi:Histidine kinase-, DNA gyrase B-, and HSP90-like ATPase